MAAKDNLAERSTSSRRKFIIGAGAAVGGFAVGFAARGLSFPASVPVQAAPTNSDDALQLLLDGNQRFAGGGAVHPNQSTSVRDALAGGQHPWAFVLSCIDSRAPPELVFDVGLGDVYAARTAGQVIDPAVQGSLEYAATHGAFLGVVMGHSNCGAVAATISAMQGSGHAPGDIDAIVQAIKPAVQSVQGQPGDLLDNSIRANTKLEVQYLGANSQVISGAVANGSLKLVGAYYDLNSGAVSLIA